MLILGFFAWDMSLLVNGTAAIWRRGQFWRLYNLIFYYISSACFRRVRSWIAYPGVYVPSLLSISSTVPNLPKPPVHRRIRPTSNTFDTMPPTQWYE